jgi:Flp pilus assembly protein TadG
MRIPRSRPHAGTRRCHPRGQALPEFALVLPLFLLVVFGIVQLGFLLAGQNGLSNAARETARYASTLPTPDTFVAGDCATNGSNAKAAYDRLRTVSLPQYIPGFLAGNLTASSPLASCGTAALNRSATGIGYCVASNPDGTYALRVRATVVYRHPLFVPLVGRVFSSTNTWQLGVSEEMRVEGPDRSTNGGFPPCS